MLFNQPDPENRRHFSYVVKGVSLILTVKGCLRHFDLKNRPTDMILPNKRLVLVDKKCDKIE